MSSCLQCHHENPPGATRCAGCGKTLSAAGGATKLGLGGTTPGGAKVDGVPEAVPEYLDTAALDDLMVEPPRPAEQSGKGGPPPLPPGTTGSSLRFSGARG